MMQQRMAWADFAKALCIVSVVLTHVVNGYCVYNRTPFRPLAAGLGIAGVLLLGWGLRQRLDPDGVLARLGRASLPIYVAHVIFAAAFRWGYVSLLGGSSSTVGIAGAILVGLVGPLVLSEAADRLRIPLFQPPRRRKDSLARST